MDYVCVYCIYMQIMDINHFGKMWKAFWIHRTLDDTSNTCHCDCITSTKSSLSSLSVCANCPSSIRSLKTVVETLQPLQLIKRINNTFIASVQHLIFENISVKTSHFNDVHRWHAIDTDTMCMHRIRNMVGNVN